MMNNKVQAAASPAAASPPLGLYISRLIEVEYRRRNMFSMIRIEYCTEQDGNRLFFMVPINIAQEMLADADEQRRSRELADNIKDAYTRICHQLDDRIKKLSLRRIAEDRPRERGFSRDSISARQSAETPKTAVHHAAILRIPQDTKQPAHVEIAVEAVDLPLRLTFLRLLKEKTVFAEHAALSLIIKDYEWALKLRTKDDDHGSQDKKGCTQRGRACKEDGPIATAKPKGAETSGGTGISLQQVSADRGNGSDRGTVEVCEALLKRALSSDLRGLICGFIEEGEQMVCVTGHFRENPADLIGITSAMDDRVKKHFGGTVKAAVKP